MTGWRRQSNGFRSIHRRCRDDYSYALAVHGGRVVERSVVEALDSGNDGSEMVWTDRRIRSEIVVMSVPTILQIKIKQFKM